MGPELGEFIAGIRNEAGPTCVHEGTRWLYASRASVWKSDDDTLKVKCFSPEGKKTENRGAIHQLLNIILKLRILVLLLVSTLPYVVKVENYS
jgi:hypothetical protein